MSTLPQLRRSVVAAADRRAAVEKRLHVPWYRRRAFRGPRTLAIALACLVATGSAFAATGVFQSGAPVAPEVKPLPTTRVGVAIPDTVRLLGLRVADPGGGPPWGLRTMKTTRGLLCVQVGRIVDGRIGVLGRDGAFMNDGRFHPLSIDYLGTGADSCGTEDANGNAFLNEEAFGVPDAGLIGGDVQVSGGCYGPHASTSACPVRARRNIYYGLLGPDATRITYLDGGGGLHSSATAGQDGAYLLVQPHLVSACVPGPSECSGHSGMVAITRSGAGETGGPTLNAFGAVRSVSYRSGSSCVLPSGAEVQAARRRAELGFQRLLRERYPGVSRRLREAEHEHTGVRLSPRERAELESLQRPQAAGTSESPCPAVGYAPLRTPTFTHAELATPISVRLLAPAPYFCERAGQGETVPCGATTPAGYRRLPGIPGRHELLAVVTFRSRIPIANYNLHYEINTTDPREGGRADCPGGSFGPSSSDYRAGQEVRFDEFINAGCPGVYRISIGLVTTNGPAGDMPVPGLPGQSPEVGVGQVSVRVP